MPKTDSIVRQKHRLPSQTQTKISEHPFQHFALKKEKPLEFW